MSTAQLAGRDYLMGKQFTVADGYLFTMLCWADRMKFDLSAMPNLMAYKARVARAAEGAGSPDQGRPDEGGVSLSPIAISQRAGSMIRPFFVVPSFPGRCEASKEGIPGCPDVQLHTPGAI